MSFDLKFDQNDSRTIIHFPMEEPELKKLITDLRALHAAPGPVSDFGYQEWIDTDNDAPTEAVDETAEHVSVPDPIIEKVKLELRKQIDPDQTLYFMYLADLTEEIELPMTADQLSDIISVLQEAFHAHDQGFELLTTINRQDLRVIATIRQEP